MRLMIFGNPALFGLLMQPLLDLFVDATFSCTRHPFSQTMIIMVFDSQTRKYVPVLYALMTHKTQELYYCIFHYVVVLSRWRLKVNSFSSDFERAIINAATAQFRTEEDGIVNGYHIGCFFHFRQAICMHTIKKLCFSAATVAAFMAIGMLDLLTIFPQEEVEVYGIPYPCQKFEGRDKDAEWDSFWTYFKKQWIPLLDSWNISLKDSKYKIL